MSTPFILDRFSQDKSDWSSESKDTRKQRNKALGHDSIFLMNLACQKNKALKFSFLLVWYSLECFCKISELL